MGYIIHIQGRQKVGRGSNRNSRVRSDQIVESGPGTELKKLLAKFGIRPHGDCKCNRRARIMDQQGAEWCTQNLDKIVGWLKEEADLRRMPFVNRLGIILVKRAIHNSRK